MNAPSLCAQTMMQSTPVLMQMVIQQQHLTMLRQALRHSCRMEVEILWLKPCAAASLRVCFLISQHLIETVMHHIMQRLPSAQFGRYHEVSETLISKPLIFDQLLSDPLRSNPLASDSVQQHVIAQLENDYAPSDPSTLYHAHTCPICQRVHQVNAAMHAHCYGKHYSCSLACELKRRQHWWHFTPAPSGHME